LAVRIGNRKLLLGVVASFVVVLSLGVGLAAATAPVVTVENASGVEYTAADVEGHVNPEGQSTSWRFQYATAADFSNAQNGPSGSTETSETVSGQLTGLQPGTTYHLRLLAENGDGQSEAVAASTFTTKTVTKPTPSEPQVSSITGNTAHFEATVNPNAPEENALLSQAAKDAYATHWWFTCEPSCSFSGPSEGDLEADNAPATVEADATGLSGNTEYTVVLHAQNASGAETAQAIFTTELIKPDVTRADLNGTEPGSTTFTLLGNVNPNGSRITDCHFVYGIGSASGNEVPCNPSSPAVYEVQNLDVYAASGEYRLTFDGEVTAELPFNASAAEIQEALEALPAIGHGNVSVSETRADPHRYLDPSALYSASEFGYKVTFVGDLTGQDLPPLGWKNGTDAVGAIFWEEHVPNSPEKSFGSPVYVGFGNFVLPPGNFRFKFESEETPPLSLTASASEVQKALEGLASIQPGQVSVEGGESEGSLGEEKFLSVGYTVTVGGGLTPEELDRLTVVPAPFIPGEIRIGTEHGSLHTSVPVTAGISGLSPNTEYRYKLVATSAAGTTEGPEISFRTLNAPQPATCPNAAIRAEQHSTSANCRGYEVVSPSDKNGADVTGEDNNVVASLDGNAAVFQSRGGFAGEVGSGEVGFTQYLSRRGPGGWTTNSLTPTPSPSSIQTLLGGNELFYFSNDLSKAVLYGYDLPQATDDIPNGTNLYRLDTGTGGLESVSLATQLDSPIGFNSFGNQDKWGASEDTGVVSFATNTRLLPEAPKGVTNAYEWDHGVLRLAGILPNGEIPAEGSTPPRYRGSVSSDGSRVLFLTPAEGQSRQLYMRRDHSDTVWVTEPEFGTPGEPKNVQLEWVSTDARQILFTTTTPLVAEDTNSAADLYLYTDGPDPESESNLKLISKLESIAPKTSFGPNAVLGATDNAQVIYFRGGALNSSNRIVRYEHGAVRVGPDNLDSKESSPMDFPGTSRVSPDGRFLAYHGEDEQLYLYDAQENTLACVSCRRDGAASDEVPDRPHTEGNGLRKEVTGLRPRFLTDDGRVFFSTASPLVSADTNGVVDTYVYDAATGERELISTGKGEDGEWFANASKSGNDVFFVTKQRLVGADHDQLVDLYDARVGGGFPEPPPTPTPCAGDNCRNPLSSQSGGASPATAGFSGRGNRHRKARHHRKHHKHHRNQKHRRKHHSKKHSSTQRSGGRG